MVLDLPEQLTTFFEPQFEQLDVTLSPRGAGAYGEVPAQRGIGSVWVLPVSESCVVIDHAISPAEDMPLLEVNICPYACVTEASCAIAAVMPDYGIDAYPLPEPSGPWPGSRSNQRLYSFTMMDCQEFVSTLRAGQTYRSRTISFLPGFFTELEERYPREFEGLFGSFGDPWDEHATFAIRTAMRRVDPARACAAGAHLFLRGTLDAMIAELAAVRAAEKDAEAARDSRASARLAEEAAALMERTLDQGHQLTIEQLAAELYVSRSRLCAVFKRETDEALGAYLRRRRIERACELLHDRTLSVAAVAARLGYPQQAAFAQAFKQATGLSPTAWRAAR